jgi:hypothetical protein
MTQRNQSIPMHQADQAFIVTVGLPMGSAVETKRHCEIVLRAIERAGYHAGPTGDEAMKIIAEQQQLINGMVSDRPETTEGG